MVHAGGLDSRITDDRDEVKLRVRAAGTSFFWAMRLLPADKRDAMYAVYAFCREVDDIADGTLSREAKRAALEDWRTEIAGLFDGAPSRAVTRALSGPVAKYGLERADFLAVIDGMEMDAEGPIRAPDWARLELYCERVAGAVGLLCVRIFGLAGPDGPALAQALGRALQLTNILRDLGEDASTGRLYLPREALERAGITAREPLAVLRDRRVREVARLVALRARRAFIEADAIMNRHDRAVVRPARIMMQVYRPLLDDMLRKGFADIGKPRPETGFGHVLSKARKLAIALRYALY